MGLNIGIEVKKQVEGYGYTGYNPKGTRAEIEERFFAFLDKKFPDDDGFGRGWVMFKEKEQKYDFDVRLAYDWNHYDCTPMFLAIAEFIYNEFSYDGLEMRTYHSP